MVLHRFFSKRCALHMRLTNFECSLNSLDHCANLNQAHVVATTLVDLAGLGNDS